MATDRKTKSNVVDRLAERIQCQLLTYNPTSPPKSRPGPQRYLFPTGSYALGLWHPGDEIHLVCLSDNSSNTFWDYVAEKLDREDLPKSDCAVSQSGDQETVWLHYCSIPPHFELATVGAYGFPKYPAVHIPQVIRDNLARLQHTWHLLDGLNDDIEAFRDANNILRRWAVAAGIFSKAFGTLDAESLVWMLFNAKIRRTKKNQIDDSSCSSDEIVQSFIEQYQTPESLYNILTPSKRKPYIPASNNVVNAHATVAQEISHLAQRPGIIDSSMEDFYKRFCSTFQTKIIIAAECWAPKQREKFHAKLTSQISCLAERIQNAESISFVRIWPYSFNPSAEEWLYVVGVQQAKECDQQASHDLLQVLELEIDTTIGAATIRKSSEEEALRLPAEHSTAVSPTPAISTPTIPVPKSSPMANKKFPPASQVLSRLRWDHAHAPFDYEVGYLDRFEGLMWLSLEQWGKETEDEEFIPEHRIRIFRRITHGVSGRVVWDREKRICELSG